MIYCLHSIFLSTNTKYCYTQIEEKELMYATKIKSSDYLLNSNKKLLISID